MNIGQKIALIRKSKKLTQEYIAERLNKTPQWLSNIERGVRQINANEFAQIANLLEVDPSIFFDSKFNKTWNNEPSAINQVGTKSKSTA